MSYPIHAARRAVLLTQIAPGGLLILPAAPERVRSKDTDHPYRFDSYFSYLTGFPEPEAVLVLIAGIEGKTSHKAVLFCREKNAERETWDGFRYGPEAAREIFGFDEAYSFSEFEAHLTPLVGQSQNLWYCLGHDDVWDSKIIAALKAARAQTRSGQRAPSVLRDPRELLDQMRLIKDSAEQNIMRRAADISSDAYRRVLRTCRPGMMEYELEAELSYEFRRRGADAHAYSPIVAGGHHACTLHYTENNKALADATLVLIDAGCEVAGYASDISRTFPVNGRFSAAQRDVYEIVLAAQTAAIAAIKPGASFNAYHDAALQVLVQGLLDLKILTGSLSGVLESETYKSFYMHRTGHWLGLDVHDVGDYKTGDEWVRLAPGMALTVEPGLYLRPGADVPAALQGIGVRIEDDVFVTSVGCEVYTTAPKTVAEIEELMREEVIRRD